MSLEKGINRIGTVSGFVLGLFLVFSIWSTTDLYTRIYLYYGVKYQEKHTHLHNTGELYNSGMFKNTYKLVRVPNEDAPSKFLFVTLPTAGTSIIISLFVFLSGLYGSKVTLPHN